MFNSKYKKATIQLIYNKLAEKYKNLMYHTKRNDYEHEKVYFKYAHEVLNLAAEYGYKIAYETHKVIFKECFRVAKLASKSGDIETILRRLVPFALADAETVLLLAMNDMLDETSMFDGMSKGDKIDMLLENIKGKYRGTLKESMINTLVEEIKQQDY